MKERCPQPYGPSTVMLRSMKRAQESGVAVDFSETNGSVVDIATHPDIFLGRIIHKVETATARAKTYANRSAVSSGLLIDQKVPAELLSTMYYLLGVDIDAARAEGTVRDKAIDTRNIPLEDTGMILHERIERLNQSTHTVTLFISQAEIPEAQPEDSTDLG